MLVAVSPFKFEILHFECKQDRITGKQIDKQTTRYYMLLDFSG